MPAVADASPLIAFARAGRLGIIQALFDEVFIPPRVVRETFRGVPSRAGASTLEAAFGSWLIERAPVDTTAVEDLMQTVDPGEAEAIVLASELGLTLLIDDRDGRRAARNHGIRITGSAGVLAFAKQRGLLALVRPVLNELLAQGLRLSPALYGEILRDVGELPDAT